MSYILLLFKVYTSTPGRRAVGAAEAPFALPRTPKPISPLCHCVVRMCKNLLRKFLRFDRVKSYYKL